MLFNQLSQAVSETKSILTWADILKLCVPLMFSLFLLWLKEWYASHRERKAKEEYLWRTINQEASELGLAIEEINKIAKAAKERKLRVVAFELSATRRNYAERLAELDYHHAYVYAGYSAQAEIVNKGLQALKEFSKAIITTEEINKPAIALAVEAQAKSLKIDLISLAENEIEILKTIKEAHERRKSFDEQQIHEYKSEIDKAKRNV